MAKLASAWSPGHITGFFLARESSDPLRSGSLGVGVNIRRGVTTVVTVDPAKRAGVTIKINGKELEAPTSTMVVNLALQRSDFRPNISIDHRCEVPIGAGFGSSGAGALSLALAINEVLDLELSKVEAAQIAHMAEIACRTGLGTVAAETVGGIEVRLSAGAPGIGDVKRIEVQDGYVVPCLSFSPISTKSVLDNKEKMILLTDLGKRYLGEFLETPTVQNLLKLSQRFAFSTGLVSGRVKQVISEAERKGFICSMAMLGESVFSIVEPKRAPVLMDVFTKYSGSDGISFLSGIAFEGAGLV